MERKKQTARSGSPPEIALYVLPNAKSIRLVETGSLLHLIHKWTMRTCFNAQEEIYQASIDELAELREVHPELSRFDRPSLSHSCRRHDADLHGRFTLLRRKGLAGFSKHDTPDLRQSGSHDRSGLLVPYPARDCSPWL